MPGHDIPGHDIIVIGTSAGGVETLRNLARALPKDLPAAVFVVLHIPSDGQSYLPSILSRSGPLPALHPEDGTYIEPGHIYVAPPDLHMLLEDHHIKLARGPKENRHRPAIDPLFRSAALAYGPRVIGTVLTGSLDDGTSGLWAIKQRGGIAVVQDPRDALYPNMPRSALQNVEADYVLPLNKIGPTLARLAHEPITNGKEYAISKELEIETRIATMEGNNMENVAKLGKPSTFSCPECHGVLWELHDGKLVRFRCQVGHAYTLDNMIASQSEAVERALWAALRALEERSEFTRRLAHRAHEGRHERAASRFEESAREIDEHISVVRQLLTSRSDEQFEGDEAWHQEIAIQSAGGWQEPG